MYFFGSRSVWMQSIGFVSAAVLSCGPTAKKNTDSRKSPMDSVLQDAPALQIPKSESSNQDNRIPASQEATRGDASGIQTPPPPPPPPDNDPETVVVIPPVGVSGAFLTLACSELPRDGASPNPDTVELGCAVREKSTGKKVYTGSSLTDWSIAMGPAMGANAIFEPITGIRVSKVPDIWDVEFLLPIAKVTGSRIRLMVKNFMDPRDALLETQLKLGAEEMPKVRGFRSAKLTNLGDGAVPEGCDPAKVPTGTPPGYRVFLPIIVTSDTAKIRLILDGVCGGITTNPSSLALRITRTNDKANMFQQLMQKNVSSLITNEMVLSPGVYNAMFSVEMADRGGPIPLPPSGPDHRLAIGSFLIVTLEGTVAVGEPQFTKR